MLKTINNYSDYMANVNGNIFSIKSNKYLKPQLYKNGYTNVDLCNNGKVKKFLIHRIIAETFLPNPKNKSQVNHINGNKSDNRVENLEWVTHSENQKHSIKLGLRSAKGIKNSQVKLSEKIILNIFNSTEKNKYLALKYNISQATICDIKKGRSWTHITGLINIRNKKNTL